MKASSSRWSAPSGGAIRAGGKRGSGRPLSSPSPRALRRTPTRPTGGPEDRCPVDRTSGDVRPTSRGSTMREPDALLPERLEAFVGCFRDEFRRQDQARWAAVYLQGLLRPGGRKNVEGLARAVTLPAGLEVEDVTQALQHFVNQSPWDEDRLWERYRSLVARRLPADGLLVLEEMAFAKQGRHSVGVHRQFSRALGRKINCQVAIALHHVGPPGWCPLGLRLYLPRGWLQDPARLQAAGVPE